MQSLARAVVTRSRNLARELLFLAWKVSGRLGWKVSAGTHERLTVVIPSYHERRARNLDPLIRACLRCTFVDDVIVSNHNPDLRLRDWVTAEDPRLRLIDQKRRYGCGHAWTIAKDVDAPHVLLVDDDLLLYPRQMVVLFLALLANPEVPHGLCGARQGQYRQRCEETVDVLYNVYAVTRVHLQRYHELSRRLELECGISHEDIEYFADDMVISRTGPGLARIHNAGFLLRCRTGSMLGVAIFKEEGFGERRLRLEAALVALRSDLV